MVVGKGEMTTLPVFPAHLATWRGLVNMVGRARPRSQVETNTSVSHLSELDSLYRPFHQTPLFTSPHQCITWWLNYSRRCLTLLVANIPAFVRADVTSQQRFPLIPMQMVYLKSKLCYKSGNVNKSKIHGHSRQCCKSGNTKINTDKPSRQYSKFEDAEKNGYMNSGSIVANLLLSQKTASDVVNLLPAKQEMNTVP